MSLHDGVLDEAVEVGKMCQQAARSFRLGEEAAGSGTLVRLVDAVGRLAARGDPRVPTLVPVLEELLAAQRRGDFLRVADVLDFVLAEALAAEG